MKISAVLFVLAISIWSCNNLSTVDEATAKDSRLGELATSDVLLFSNGETGGGGKTLLNGGYDTTCMTIDQTVTTDNRIKKVITFNGCEMGDGVVRTGKLIIIYTPRWKQTIGAGVEVEFVDFKRGNEVTLNGKHILKLKKLEPITLEITAQDMVMKFENGEEFKWSGTRTIEWLKGFWTPRIRIDDSLRVNHNLEGYNRKGEKFTNTGTDLIWTACQGKMKITAGTMVIKNIDKNKTITIEFNGCDSYTINGIRVNN